MKEWLLRAAEFSAGYDGNSAVQGVTFSVKPGEIVALIGPNGAGKSTILKTVAGQLSALTGTVLLNGKSISEIEQNKLAKNMSILTTDRARLEDMTVRDVVNLGRYPYTGMLGILSAHDVAVTDSVMQRLQISDLADRRFPALSDGQRQRVMLARALCQEPEVLVLDEPTSFLDIRYQLELLNLLRELCWEQNLAVILSLQEVELARRVPDTVVCVKNGAVDRVGVPEEVLTDAYVEKLYDMSEGAYTAFYRDKKTEMGSSFFQNRACEKFPCHKGVPEEQFNCLFCYCPLYALGERCGGSFHYTEKGYKSCVDCGIPHEKENYRKIISRYPEIAALTEQNGHVRKGQKFLRCGFTTGTCAALAACAAARLLLTGERRDSERLITPKGTTAELPLERCERVDDAAVAAVRKDAGDDPDVTDGCLICATVRKTTDGISVDGGEGIGRVTRPGLDQSVGAAAINTVPRRMITEAVEAVAAEAGYDGGLAVEISAPEGVELAGRTFNPQLGIEGGISILGTSGVVEPMSEQAVVDTIETELRQKRAEGAERVILTPGNYGADFLRSGGLTRANVSYVKYSNFLGDSLDLAVTMGYREALLVGHIGKLVKLAGGIMNTHSKYADCRTELLCAHAALQGASAEICRRLMDAATTDACIAVLDESGLRASVLDSLLSAMQRQLDHRVGEALRIGAVVFSNTYGLLGMTDKAKALLEAWKE